MQWPFKPTPPRLVALSAVLLCILWCAGSAVSLLSSRSQLDSAWQSLEHAETARVQALEAFERAAVSVQPFEEAAFRASQEARQSWSAAESVTSQVAAIHQLDTAQTSLRNVLAEYDQLAAQPAYADADRTLRAADSVADEARLAYDRAVQLFNVRLLVFPRNVLAGLFGVESAPRFQFAENVPSA